MCACKINELGSEKMYKLPLIVLAALKSGKRKSHSASGMTLKESAVTFSQKTQNGTTFCTALNEL